MTRRNDLVAYAVAGAAIVAFAILPVFALVRPPGWEEAAAPFSDDTPRSVADIDSDEAFQRVRAFKKDMKAKGKQKTD